MMTKQYLEKAAGRPGTSAADLPSSRMDAQPSQKEKDKDMVSNYKRLKQKLTKGQLNILIYEWKYYFLLVYFLELTCVAGFTYTYCLLYLATKLTL